MVVRTKAGSLSAVTQGQRELDWLSIEWFESNKRILHKRTQAGRELVIRMLNERPNLQQGDLLFMDDALLIAVAIKVADAIRYAMHELVETAAFCYEVGNKHLPLFADGNDLLIPFDAPAFAQLQAAGFKVERCEAVLQGAFRTSVLPHGHQLKTRSLLDRILNVKPGSDE